ncbi:hypothetical protein [Phenylobacterium sp.]|jgi:hypothetical protein|uniref:hypothetical protein n=1 Tax=Phenylobacterium sp. TaxID=1871053 RepID=UPI0025FEA377|nr:hypothetical protein [Phenylobacterium sp.]|tara:strand:+ start:5410 stop:5766 length:357 start_codon:yes stop_codon:yes gene_type:complete
MHLDEFVAVFGIELPVSVPLLRGEIRKGKLPAKKVAGKLFITPSQVRELFQPCRPDPKAPASTSGAIASIAAAAGRSPTSTSSAMDRFSAARDAALIACQKLSGGSESTSRGSKQRQH